MGQIYRHVSPVGKSYIGKTRYTWQIRAGSNPEQAYYGSVKFLHAIRKYGWDNLIHEVLEDEVSDDLLTERENYWIDFYDSIHSGYNFTGGNLSMDARIDKLPLSVEDFSRLYYVDGLSLREIASRYETEITTIRRFMERHSLDSLGKGNLGSIRRAKIAEMREAMFFPRPCAICGVIFTPPVKADAQTCSRSCRGRYRRPKT